MNSLGEFWGRVSSNTLAGRNEKGSIGHLPLKSRVPHWKSSSLLSGYLPCTSADQAKTLHFESLGKKPAVLEISGLKSFRPGSGQEAALSLPIQIHSPAPHNVRRCTYVVIPCGPARVQLHVKLSLLPGQLIVFCLLFSGQCMPLEGEDMGGIGETEM